MPQLDLFDFNSRTEGQFDFLSHAFPCTEGATLAISSTESDEDPETWIDSHFDTPLGPMLEHQFGPFALTFVEPLGPKGMASSVLGGLPDLARHFLLTQWNELRAMPKALGRFRPHS